MELILTTWSKSIIKFSFYPVPYFRYSGYFLSFFWFFDLIAIFSLWPDIDWISEPLGLALLSSSSVNSNGYSSAARVVRLVRLVRVMRLLRFALERRRAEKRQQELLELVERGEIDVIQAQREQMYNVERQSKLGTELSSVIMKHVVIILLAMLIVLPTLQYSPPDNGPEYGISFIQQVNMNPNISIVAKKGVVSEILSDLNPAPQRLALGYLLSLKVQPLYDGYVYIDQEALDSSRKSVLQTISYSTFVPSSNTTYITEAVVSYRFALIQSAEYTMYLTICVAFLLVASYLVFTSDIQRLVLTPIDRMITMVEMVAEDPLQTIQDLRRNNSVIKNGSYETKILESSLEKVTGLLRVGFGEAGAKIISDNLRTENSHALNALIPGERVYGIFGFCDIHHFEESS